MMMIKENEMIENNEIITTDTEGIYMRDYQDTLVTREIPNNYGYYNDAGEYVENGTHTITHYRYAHNPMELYEANAEQQGLYLIDYVNNDKIIEFIYLLHILISVEIKVQLAQSLKLQPLNNFELYRFV